MRELPGSAIVGYRPISWIRRITIKCFAFSIVVLAVFLVGPCSAAETPAQPDGVAADASNWAQFGRTSGTAVF